MAVIAKREEHLSNDVSAASVGHAMPMIMSADARVSRERGAVVRRLDAMKDHLLTFQPASGNEALKLLRAAFPDSPLSERVAALGVLSGGSDTPFA
ncbi:hypothetical protein [Methylobrevis pamukkalensis]|uniref:Uncharacterized protein n=1 Tax=Methylobrevis pamukkalensis TaxID=1439726 RepID=A0A1E3H2Q5_9HYPH|nr:hypothetical protein [Methylobrevis pamukkalensis]ODN70607.1 hypothetical protein A6302_02095 [Methylobrevis pamukkalensis]